MREIKFRAWDKETKTMISDEWIQTLDLRGDGSWTIYLGGGMKQYLTQKQSDKKITDCVLLQYTGLKDKNGKEIYEGDIVCQFKGSEYKAHYIVCWRNDHAGFWLYYKDEPHLDLNHYRVKLEVIGNIYENPELMEIK
jgi:uncharacterized phage protein (TIGR01671 family)